MKSLKFIGEIYKKGFGTFKSYNRLAPDGTEKSRYMILVSLLEMISVTVSLIAAIASVVGFFTGRYNNMGEIIYKGFVLKVIGGLCITSAIFNALDRFQKETQIGKIKRLKFMVIINILCLISFEARNFAVGIFGLVKLVCIPIAFVACLIFIFSELAQMSSIDNEYNSIKEPMKVFLTHIIVLPIWLLLLQLATYAVQMALLIVVFIVLFGGIKGAISLSSTLPTPSLGSANGGGVKKSGQAKNNFSDVNRYRDDLKKLERGLEGARRKEIGYGHVNIKGEERRAEDLRRKINKLEGK